MFIDALLHYVKGSAEELIKQELQAVAEGVAASVFQSATHSNRDLSMQVNDESVYGNNQEREVQESDVERQHKAKLEVLNFTFHSPSFCVLLIFFWCFLFA